MAGANNIVCGARASFVGVKTYTYKKKKKMIK